MKATVRRVLATAAIVVSVCLASEPARHKPKAPPAVSEKVDPGTRDARVYQVNDRQTVTVNAKVNYDTLIMFPPAERVLEAGTGDLANAAEALGGWIVRANRNIVHVKPTSVGVESNLHMVSETGRVYSFLLREVSGCKACRPDLKLFVEPLGDDALGVAARQREEKREKETANKIAELLARAESAEKSARDAKENSEHELKRAVDQFRASYSLRLRCDYDFVASKPPFFVMAICTDGAFTFVKSASREMPTLYTFRDGKPALVQFKYERGKTATQGTYVVEGVLTNGYLALGKRNRLRFQTLADKE
jgi:hypothetical protein